MKKLIATLLLSICISSVALAGDIPGSGPVPPPPPCSENCGAAQASDSDEISAVEVVTGLFSLIF